MQVAIINNTAVESHYGCARVMCNLDLLCEELGWAISIKCATGESADSVSKKLDSVTFDILLVNGEGTLHDNNSYHLEVIKVCDFVTLQNKKVVILNASIYLQDKNKLLALEKVSSLIVVRSKAVQSQLSLKGIESFFLPDLTFYIQKANTETYAPKSQYLFTDSVSCATSFKQIVRSFFEKSSDYVPFIYPPDKKLAILRYIKRHFVTCKTFQDFLSFLFVALFGVIKAKPSADPDLLVAHYERVVSGRFHAICFCIKNAIPFDYIDSNTPKIRHMLQDVGIDKFFELDGDVYRLNHGNLDDYTQKCKKYNKDAISGYRSLVTRLKNF